MGESADVPAPTDSIPKPSDVTMAGTPDDDITPSVFRLLCDEYALFLRRTGSSKPFADRLVEKYLEEGERDRDGRIRYKILEVHALPGGLTPSPYDGDFWRSYPERGIRCDIKPWDSEAHWTGTTSAAWKEFDGREVADYRVIGIRLNHDIVLEFLESAGLHERTQSDESETGSTQPLSPESSEATPSVPSTTPAASQKSPAAPIKVRPGAERKYDHDAIQALALEQLKTGPDEHRSWFYERVREAGKDHQPRVRVPGNDRTLGRIVDALYDKAKKCAERKRPDSSFDSH